MCEDKDEDERLFTNAVTDIVSTAPSVLNNVVSKFRNLHFFGYSAGRDSPRNCQQWGWWRIIRSEGSGVPVHFKRLGDAEAEEIEEHLTSMDGESLRNFDIDTFLV